MINKWILTNGIIEMTVCTVCGQPYQEGHIDCTCDKNHPEDCKRPTYHELQDRLETSSKSQLGKLSTRSLE